MYSFTSIKRLKRYSKNWTIVKKTKSQRNPCQIEGLKRVFQMHVYYVACSISREVCLNNEMFGVGFLFPLSFELGFVKQVYLIRAASIIWKLPHVRRRQR